MALTDVVIFTHYNRAGCHRAYSCLFLLYKVFEYIEPAEGFSLFVLHTNSQQLKNANGTPVSNTIHIGSSMESMSFRRVHCEENSRTVQVTNLNEHGD